MKNIGVPLLRVCALIVILGFSFVWLAPLFVPEAAGLDSAVGASANGIFYEKENSIDVVFLGDSEAYASISPMLLYEKFGFTSYVCATSCQKLTDSYAYLEQIIKKQKPSVVFLETNALYRTYSLINALMAKGERVLPLLKYHDRWKTMLSKLLFNKTAAVYRDDLKGFHYNTAVQGYTGSEDYMKDTQETYEIPALNSAQLEEICRLCRENGIRLVLFSVPSPVNWSREKHNGVEKFARRAKVDYIDLNTGSERVKIHWQTETYDKGDHLNYSGAVKVSMAVGEYISRKIALADKRRDPVFDDWNAALKRYHTAVHQV